MRDKAATQSSDLPSFPVLLPWPAQFSKDRNGDGGDGGQDRSAQREHASLETETGDRNLVQEGGGQGAKTPVRLEGPGHGEEAKRARPFDGYSSTREGARKQTINTFEGEEIMNIALSFLIPGRASLGPAFPVGALPISRAPIQRSAG